jgi:hypothetical protein
MKTTEMFRVRERGTDSTIANVKKVVTDDNVIFYVQWFGEGDWEEDDEGLGLLLGDVGAVERVGKG